MFNPTIESYSGTRNKVLTQTYMLLAISLLPTALGAWIGVATGLSSMFQGGLGLILFLAGAFGFIFAIEKTKNSAAGVPVLLAFTFFMGLMLSSLIGRILGYSNGAALIGTAFLATSLILFGMSALATTIKRDLSAMGKFLFVGVIMLLVASLLNFFFQSPVLMIVLSVLAIGIFSAYILYDVKQILDGGETNYITATLSIYLSVFNIFQSLLSLLGLGFGERE